MYKQALQEQPDDWALLQLYLDCQLPGTACTVPAIGSTAVAQMLTGVEASTVPGISTGGLQALMAKMNTGRVLCLSMGACPCYTLFLLQCNTVYWARLLGVCSLHVYVKVGYLFAEVKEHR